MAGVYIHIPFCKKACHYCNFHFSTSGAGHQDMANAILDEIHLRRSYLEEPVSTIYFGGGTPSILPTANIQRIISEIMRTFDVVGDPEITFEANPDDITSDRLNEWKQIGINRLSIGVQSFFDEDLRWMNRAHSGSQALHCIELAQAAGFSNITIDLIYGTPTLTDEKWKANVERAFKLQIPHLSCYALTVEPKTALDKLIKQKKVEEVDTEKQARHFELLMQWTQEAGFEQYEISNFATPGNRSRHNSSYWQGKPYLGIGPSAHSFARNTRQWNVANNALYLQSIARGVVAFEQEVLTREQQMNEYIMTSLRTSEGVSLTRVRQEFGTESLEMLVKTAQPHLNNRYLVVKDDYLLTTREGKLLADGIAADLFIL